MGPSLGCGWSKPQMGLDSNTVLVWGSPRADLERGPATVVWCEPAPGSGGGDVSQGGERHREGLPLSRLPLRQLSPAGTWGDCVADTWGHPS